MQAVPVTGRGPASAPMRWRWSSRPATPPHTTRERAAIPAMAHHKSPTRSGFQLRHPRTERSPAHTPNGCQAMTNPQGVPFLGHGEVSAGVTGETEPRSGLALWVAEPVQITQTHAENLSTIFTQSEAQGLRSLGCSQREECRCFSENIPGKAFPGRLEMQNALAQRLPCESASQHHVQRRASRLLRGRFRRLFRGFRNGFHRGFGSRRSRSARLLRAVGLHHIGGDVDTRIN